MNRCKECGKEIEDGEKLCYFCEEIEDYRYANSRINEILKAKEKIKQFGREAWNRLSAEEQQSHRKNGGAYGFVKSVVKICCPLKEKELSQTEWEELHDYIVYNKLITNNIDTFLKECNAMIQRDDIQASITLGTVTLNVEFDAVIYNAIIDALRAIKEEVQECQDQK